MLREWKEHIERVAYFVRKDEDIVFDTKITDSLEFFFR